jgi:two-component system chemotaxis response regulator CheY
MKALVIESSNTMRSVLSRLLSLRGFEVVEAESPEDAMEALNKMGAADLVLVDWAPHEISSLEFIARLRHEAADRPMVIMLATVEPGIRRLRRALIAGADDYLMKPFTSLQIDEKLAQAGFAWRM